MSNEAILKLGLPKGSLEEATIDLFARAGWKVRRHARNYFPDVNDPELDVTITRVQEVGDYIAAGVIDAGISAIDWLDERDLTDKVVKVADLVYAKTSNRPTRWVLAVAGDSPITKPEDLSGKRVATEVVNLTRKYLARHGVTDARIFYSWGATEGKVIDGLADAIVEVTETGTTIRANGLKIVDEVMQSNPVMVAHPDAWADPKKRAKIEQLVLLLQGALRAQGLVALKMNAPSANLDAILKLLPSLNSPTVSPLQDSKWVSLETVVKTGLVRDLIPQLRTAGAEGIIEYALNKVI